MLGKSQSDMLVRKEYLNILQKQRALSHAAVLSLWFEGWLVSLASVYIYSALVYLATVLFLHRDSWLSWHLLRCSVPNYCCCWLVKSLLSSLSQKWSWAEEQMLWNLKLGSHFWNPALSIWPHSEFRAHPLSSSLVTAQIWSSTCVYLCVCALRGLNWDVSHYTAKKEVSLYQTTPLLRGTEIIILLFKTFWNVFHFTALLLTSGLCWTSFKGWVTSL